MDPYGLVLAHNAEFLFFDSLKVLDLGVLPFKHICIGTRRCESSSRF